MTTDEFFEYLAHLPSCYKPGIIEQEIIQITVGGKSFDVLSAVAAMKSGLGENYKPPEGRRIDSVFAPTAGALELSLYDAARIYNAAMDITWYKDFEIFRPRLLQALKLKERTAPEEKSETLS